MTAGPVGREDHQDPRNPDELRIELQRAEAELRAVRETLAIEREQLTQSLALAGIGTWRADLRSETVTWSAEMYRIFGRVPHDGVLDVEEFYERVHPDDREGVRAAYREAVVGGESYAIDHRVVRAGGEVRWVHARCEIHRDPEGRPLVSLGTTQDITDRKLAETQLEYTLQLIRIASRVGRIGGWDVDLLAGTVSWSDEVCAIHGVASGHRPTLDEAIAFYKPESRVRIRRLVELCIQDGTPFDAELEIVNAAGEKVWVRSIGEAQTDASGSVVGVRGAFQDISERVNAIQALRASDERFRLVAQASSDVVWDWDLVSDVCWFSEGLQSMFGHDASTARTGAFWLENVHPDDLDRVSEGIHAAIDGAKAWTAQYRFQKADGTYAMVVDRALVAHTDSGRADRMLGAMVDVTQQRVLEARLEQAQRLAGAGQLASNMAHEFNNVLMGIQPFVEVIRRVARDLPKALDAAERINQSVKRGKEMTEDILKFTRRVEHVLEPTDVREWLLEFASQAGTLADSEPRERMPAAAAAARKGEEKPRARKVLIVDDEHAVVDGITMLLAGQGLESASVLDGSGAVAAIEGHGPDVVLLDIALPGISGVELFKRIRARWPHLHVVFMSGHYKRSDLGTILDDPCVRFLQKPFGEEGLLKAML